MEPLKIAIIGLDTSHSVALPKLMNDPECPADLHVDGLQAVTCLRFETPFQNAEGLDKRQQQLEAWGVKVTEDFAEAVADCDAIMLEINDPAYHLAYFARVAALGKPVFLDKPLAGDLEEGRAILQLAKQQQTRVWSGSSLPLAPSLQETVNEMEGDIILGHCFGALGNAPAGDSLIWYGVHSFEMLQRVMGMGAEEVWAMDNGVSVVSVVNYPNERRGVVESIRNAWKYGGRVQTSKQVGFFEIDSSKLYYNLLLAIKAFFLGGEAPVSMEQTFEGLAMMAAARKSIETGKPQPVEKL